MESGGTGIQIHVFQLQILGFGFRQTVHILACSLNSCVTLGRLLNLSVPQFLHLKIETIIVCTYYLIGYY